MVKIEEYPAEGDLVVGTVKNVKEYGAFVRLDEYPGKEGFIHISEVSTGWIKYIRDHIWEGQRVVCKVLRVKKDKGHIDLSLKAVNDHQRREKIQQWKNEVKAENLFQLLARKLGRDVMECYEEFGYGLVEAYGSLYGAFEECAINPEVFRKDHSGPWVDRFIEIAVDSIVPPHVVITGLLNLICPRPDGVIHIKEALKRVMHEDESVKVDVSYIAAPKYRITVRAPDYKTAEAMLREAAQRGIEYIREVGGTGEFHRKELS